MAQCKLPGPMSQAERPMSVQDGTLARQSSPRPGTVGRDGGVASGLTPEHGELALDMAQAALDIVGIFEPTPFADGTNALISAGRGDWLGAGLSCLGMIPYVGDLAKTGKLPRYVHSIKKAIHLAQTDKIFAGYVDPILSRMKQLLESNSIASLPDSIRVPIKSIKEALDNFIPSSPNSRMLNTKGEVTPQPAKALAPRSFQDAIKLVNAADVGSRGKGIVLWTGYKEGNRTAAEAFVRQKQTQGIELTTLEMTPGGRQFEQMDLSALSDLERDRVWRRLSERFVELATGNVYVFRKGTSQFYEGVVKPTGVDDYIVQYPDRVRTFTTIEQQILKRKKAMGSITEIVFDPS